MNIYFKGISEAFGSIQDSFGRLSSENLKKIFSDQESKQILENLFVEISKEVEERLSTQQRLIEKAVDGIGQDVNIIRSEIPSIVEQRLKWYFDNHNYDLKRIGEDIGNEVLDKCEESVNKHTSSLRERFSQVQTDLKSSLRGCVQKITRLKTFFTSSKYWRGILDLLNKFQILADRQERKDFLIKNSEELDKRLRCTDRCLTGKLFEDTKNKNVEDWKPKKDNAHSDDFYEKAKTIVMTFWRYMFENGLPVPCIAA